MITNNQCSPLCFFLAGLATGAVIMTSSATKALNSATKAFNTAIKNPNPIMGGCTALLTTGVSVFKLQNGSNEKEETFGTDSQRPLEDMV
jgi:hypothetical protein